jgi:hypothetical protein
LLKTILASQEATDHVLRSQQIRIGLRDTLDLEAATQGVLIQPFFVASVFLIDLPASTLI